MRGFISTSSRSADARFFLALALLLLGVSLVAVPRHACAAGEEKKDSKTTQPEEDDFTGTPYTDYGEFNEEEDEEEASKFMKFGRLFGVSLGLGFEGVTGYKGAIYEGGFPVVDGKIHYWFDFHFALALDVAWSQHSYNDDISTSKGGQISVNIIRFGLDAKYYFDTHNLSAPLSFANPYLIIGFGAFAKSESSVKKDSTENDTAVGISPGVGLEFTVKPRKVFFALEGKYSIVSFPKDNTDRFANSSPKLENFTGNFFSVAGSFLLTW